MFLVPENSRINRHFFCILAFFVFHPVYALAVTPSSQPSNITSNQNIVALATNNNASFTANVPALSRQEDVSPLIDCVFDRIKQSYSVRVIPWRRAYQDVKNNRIDGFFTAIPMSQIDPHAVLSAPLLLENWYWFWRTNTIAPESWRAGYKLGSILGSQQEAWLEDAGYNIDITANNLPQLIRQLKTGRIDVLLADKDHFQLATRELGLDSGEFQSRFFRYVPLGVYFNEAFLNRNPDFLTGFNRNINGCNTEHFQISDYEREHILKLLSRKIERWRHLPGLEKLLKEYNSRAATRTRESLLALDAEWRSAFLSGDSDFIYKHVDKSMSTELREIKNQAQQILTEIIITDLQGANVAISDITSDYWQGDEEKYTGIFGKPAESIYFGNITYDESTKLFQVQMSIQLQTASTARPLGVMILGINVEEALSLKN